MTKHIVLGSGNLGQDIASELFKQGEEYRLMSKSSGFEYPCSMAPIVASQPKVVWVAIGSGSVDACKNDFKSALLLHVALVQDLIQSLPKDTHIICFSTDYAANESASEDHRQRVKRPRSLYALSKVWMEKLVRWSDAPNVHVIRIGSLYGSHKPMHCFPGKLRARYPVPCELTLPWNQVTPTPTSWLAYFLINHLPAIIRHPEKILHCAPQGFVTIADWGRIILGPEYSIIMGKTDPERPPLSRLGCTFASSVPDWSTLWRDCQ